MASYDSFALVSPPKSMQISSQIFFIGKLLRTDSCVSSHPHTFFPTTEEAEGVNQISRETRQWNEWIPLLLSEQILHTRLSNELSSNECDNWNWRHANTSRLTGKLTFHSARSMSIRTIRIAWNCDKFASFLVAKANGYKSVCAIAALASGARKTF